MSKRILSLVLALVMVLGTFGTVFAETVIVPGQETEVTDHEYGSAYAKLSALNIAQGKTGGKGADLDANLTRAEAAKIVLHMLGLQEGIVNNGPTGNEFKDVTSANHWASQYISVAARQGIVNGKGNGMFDPEAPVTEQEFVAMIVRALEWGPIVGGNYPYGEYAKALELDIIEKAPSKADATRGYAFSVAANGLTAQMATRKATEGSLTYEGEGFTTLLRDRLGVETFNDAVVVKTARMEREYKETEFEAAREVRDGQDVKEFIYKGEGFDATTILGDFVNVWYKVDKATKENVVVYAEENANFTKVEGIVEEYKDNQLKLESGRTYNVKDVEMYVDNNANKAPKKGNYVTVTLSRDNKVKFVDAFDLTVGNGTDTLDLVSKVIKAEDNRFEYENQNAVKRTITDEKVIVLKNNKIAKVEDITEFDLVKGIKVAGQAKTTFVLVVGEKVEGKVEKATITSSDDEKIVTILLGDKEIIADGNNFLVVAEEYKESKVTTTPQETVDELKENVDKEVTLITVAGKAKVVIGEVVAKDVNSGLVLNAGLVKDNYNDKKDATFKILKGDNKTSDLVVTKNPGEVVYPHNEMEGNNATNGVLDGYSNVQDNDDKITLFYNLDGKSFIKDKKTVDAYQYEIDKTESETVSRFKDHTLKTDVKTYNLTDSTIVYGLNKDGEYKAYKYGEVKGTTIVGDLEVYVRRDAKTANYVTPIADVVVVTAGVLEFDLEEEFGVVTSMTKSYNKDSKYVLLKVKQANETVEYIVKEDEIENFTQAGLAVTFKLTGKTVYEKTEIKDVVAGEEGTLSSHVYNNRYVIDGETIFAAKKVVEHDFDKIRTDKSYRVSYVQENGNGNVRAIAVLDETTGGVRTGVEVSYIDRDRDEIELRGDDKVYKVGRDAARLLNTLITRGSDVSFELDSKGVISKFTFVKLYAGISSADVSVIDIINQDGLYIDGNNKTVSSAINVDSNKVEIKDLTMSGTTTIASGVTEFTVDGVNMATLTLNGGGTNSVHLNKSYVATLKIKANVKVEVDGKLTATSTNSVGTIDVDNALTNVTIVVEDNAVVGTIAAGNSKVTVDAKPENVGTITGDNVTYTQEVGAVENITDAVYGNKLVTVSFDVKDKQGKAFEGLTINDVKAESIKDGVTTKVNVKSVKVAVETDTKEKLVGTYDIVLDALNDWANGVGEFFLTIGKLNPIKVTVK